MHPSLAIGDFARATHLTVKTLRHYHGVGLLEPADVDPDTGYRRYSTDQIPTAQVIRRFRELDMPLDDIRAVLAAPDLAARNELIAAHLNRLESALVRTENAVGSLRDLLRSPAEPVAIERRSVPATPAAAVTETVVLADVEAWYAGAIGELRGTLAAQGVPVLGPPGGIYDADLFAYERGRATMFLPCDGVVRPTGRVTPLVVPGTELAVIVHSGPGDGIDRSYGMLAEYVTRHALAVDGPIREYYLVDGHDTEDSAQWRTEVGWPIFATGG